MNDGHVIDGRIRATLLALAWSVFGTFTPGESAYAQGQPSPGESAAVTTPAQDPVAGAPVAGLATGSWLFASHPAGDSKIYRLNEFDGGADLIGEIGRNATSDIAFLPDGRLFGIRICCGPGRTSDLLWINPRTGVGDIVGNMGTTGVNALVAAADGTMYAASNTGEFLEIDVETGAATLVGQLGDNLASLGDLEFDDEGTLFASVAMSPDFSAPIPAELAIIDPATGEATVIGPIGFDDVFGLAFHPGVVLDIGEVEIRGPALFGLTAGLFPGTDPELIVIDRATGEGQLVATLSSEDSMSGMAANFRLAPTQGRVETVSFTEADPGNQCEPGSGAWLLCQHKAPPAHAPDIDADDTFAWDANLTANADAGEPVYAVAPGKVVSQYGETAPGGGDFNAVLVEHCLTGACDCQAMPSECWWSRYLRMDSVQVVENQQVDTATILGFVSNMGPGEGAEEHLHFAFYEGENRRQAGQGLLTSIDAVVVSVPPMFADGFESGDTSAWSSAVQ